MLTLKHLRTLRHVSILIDHHQGFRRCLIKVTEFKKKSLVSYVGLQSNITHQWFFKIQWL